MELESDNPLLAEISYFWNHPVTKVVETHQLGLLPCFTYYAAVIIRTRCIKNSNLRKEVGIAIKSKETSSQFESVRKSYVASYNAPACNYLLNHVVKCMYK